MDIEIKDCGDCKNYCAYYIKTLYGYKKMTIGVCKIDLKIKKGCKRCEKYEQADPNSQVAEAKKALAEYLNEVAARLDKFKELFIVE